MATGQPNGTVRRKGTAVLPTESCVCLFRRMEVTASAVVIADSELKLVCERLESLSTKALVTLRAVDFVVLKL